MFTYSQTSGVMSHDGAILAVGYSGFAAGKDNPAMQDQPNVGPVPQGRYSIGEVFESETHGPVVMRLTPEEGAETFGRSGFLIHGDSILHPGSASHGCIILPRPARVAIASLQLAGDAVLEVTA